VERRIVHFLLHVPKCAGTTARAHFGATLGPGYLLAPRWANPLRAILGDGPGLRTDNPRLPAVRLITGHSLSAAWKRHFPGAEIRESVLLRDPVGYHLSMYNFRASHGPVPDFARWYAVQRRDPVCRFLLNHYYDLRLPALYRLSSRGRLAFLEARLRAFWFVGSYRRADELFAAISRDLGVPEQAARRNVTEAPALTEETLAPTMRARILAENPVDRALWERWQDRGWKADAAALPPLPPLPDADRLRLLGSDIATLVRRQAAHRQRARRGP